MLLIRAKLFFPQRKSTSFRRLQQQQLKVFRSRLLMHFIRVLHHLIKRNEDVRTEWRFDFMGLSKQASDDCYQIYKHIYDTHWKQVCTLNLFCLSGISSVHAQFFKIICGFNSGNTFGMNYVSKYTIKCQKYL